MGFCSSFFCWADTVHLKNGDNLSGKIKLVDDNKLLIETEYGGVITINSSKIETFSIDEPVKIKQGLFSKPQYTDAIKTAPNHQVTIVKDGESETITINNDLTITNNKPDSLVASDWIINGGLNAGAYYNKGASKSEQYSFNGRVALKYDLWRHGIKGAIFRAKNEV